MSALVALLEAGAVRTVGWTIGHSLWQAALVALAVAALLRLVPRRLPELRCWIAIGGLAAFALGVATTGSWLAADWREHAGCWERVRELRAAPLTAAEERACASHGVFRKSDEEEAGSAARRLGDVGISPGSMVLALTPAAGWAALLWCLGLLVCGARLARDLSLARRLAGGAGLRIEGPVADALARAAGRLDVRGPVALGVSGEVESPCVLGWARPVILVPERAARSVDPASLEALLGHELAHVRRHDYAVNLVQRTLEAVFFFNPFLRWISGRVREEREACCDRLAAGASPDGLGRYIAALCAVEDLRPRRGSMASGVGLHTGARLLPRVRRLVESSRSPSPIPRSRLALRLVAAAAVVGLSAHALASTSGFWARTSAFGVMVHDNEHRERVPRPAVLAVDRDRRSSTSDARPRSPAASMAPSRPPAIPALLPIPE